MPNDNYYEPTETPAASYDMIGRVADLEAWHSVASHTGIPGVGAGGGLPTGWTQDEADPANVSTEGGSLTGNLGAIVLTLDMDANTQRVKNLADPDDDQDAVTKVWVLANVPAGTPGLADVLNESNDADGNNITAIANIEIDGDLNHDGTAVGFYGTAPAARPQVPAIPTAQNIVDALVTLGLITQAAP